MRYRVLHVITRLPVGGAERLLADVVRILDRDRFESVVCCIQDGGSVADEIAMAGIPVFTLGLMERGGFDRRVVPALCGLVQREHIDLIHSHLYHANLYGRLAALKSRIPAIASVHNAYTRRKWYRHVLNYFLARKSAAVIAVSEDIRRDILRYDHIPARKVVVVTNGIDISRVATDLTPEAAKARLGFTTDTFLLGCVGRLEEQKGHIYLLSALASLHSSYPHLELIIAGDGRNRKQLETLAIQLGIAPIVHFLGVREDVADILRAIDLYVMPSLWEGLSLAMLEAMAAKLPVIVSNVGGVSEVLGNNEYGRLVPPKDVDTLATELKTLIDSPMLRQDLARKAQQRIRGRYDAPTMKKKIESIYVAAVSPIYPRGY